METKVLSWLNPAPLSQPYPWLNLEVPEVLSNEVSLKCIMCIKSLYDLVSMWYYRRQAVFVQLSKREGMKALKKETIMMLCGNMSMPVDWQAITYLLPIPFHRSSVALPCLALNLGIQIVAV